MQQLPRRSNFFKRYKGGGFTATKNIFSVGGNKVLCTSGISTTCTYADFPHSVKAALENIVKISRPFLETVENPKIS